MEWEGTISDGRAGLDGIHSGGYRGSQLFLRSDIFQFELKFFLVIIFIV